MNRLEYLVKTLSRTKRKDYENYVINRIYNKLDDLEIKPVSQQYVKRGDDGYALIDLYFPQLNIGIECDEEHHAKQVEADALRFEDILNAIDSYEEIRIVIYENDGKDCKNRKMLPLETVNKEIDLAVKRIKRKKEETKKFVPWSDKADVELALEKGSVSIYDGYIFNKQEEIRKLFGRSGKTQKSYYKIRENSYLWLPGLAIENNGNYVKYNENLEFINIISNDGKTIYEHAEELKLEKEENDRIVFVKVKDKILNKQVYKFAGVFKKINDIEYKRIDGERKGFTVYKRIKEDIIL